MQRQIQKARRSKSRAKGVIFPHEGRELQLMLKGKKPLARFTRKRSAAADAAVEAAFAPHVARGKLARFEFRSEDTARVYYCLPTEEWRVKLLELIDAALETGAHAFTIYDLHRIDGAMLGYAKADIEAFVERWRQNEAKPRRAAAHG